MFDGEGDGEDDASLLLLVVADRCCLSIGSSSIPHIDESRG
jgi:hypothetical protein